MFRYYNPNPAGKAVGDCSVRAISGALGISWEDAYILLVEEAWNQRDMPSANAVWGEVLRQEGYSRRLPSDVITVEDFSEDHPYGTYVLALSGHVVCMTDGDIYDTWDAGRETVIYYWEEEI